MNELKNESHVFFYGGESIYSNFHPSKFYLWGFEFHNGEQAFQWAKACHFKCRGSMTAIMATTDPGEAKYIGRRVTNFDDEEWLANAERYMITILTAKFEQNFPMLAEMITHYNQGLRFVEASKKDIRWGIGMWADQAIRVEPHEWQGENRLGSCLNTTCFNLLRRLPWLQSDVSVADFKAMVEQAIEERESDD